MAMKNTVARALAARAARSLRPTSWRHTMAEKHADDPPRFTQRGLYANEMQVGAVYEHRPGRTVTEADNTLFSTMAMNPQPLHLDAAFSQTTEFGQRLVNSMFTLATLIGARSEEHTSELQSRGHLV